MSENQLRAEIEELCQRAKAASIGVAELSSTAKNEFLLHAAERLEAAKDSIRIGGRSFEWQNFEQLETRIVKIPGSICPGLGLPFTEIVPFPGESFIDEGLLIPDKVPGGDQPLIDPTPGGKIPPKIQPPPPPAGGGGSGG